MIPDPAKKIGVGLENCIKGAHVLPALNDVANGVGDGACRGRYGRSLRKGRSILGVFATTGG